MYILYCKTCKETVGWGTVRDSLLSMQHTSAEDVQAMDGEGKPVVDKEGKPVMITRPVCHECGVFEIDELPDVPHDPALDDNPKATEKLKEASKIEERKLILDRDCISMMK